MKRCDIISIVKKLSFLTISLCTAACSALTCGGLTAFADTGAQTVYPESTFIQHANDGLSGISDYAANGGIYAFADGNSITVIESENRTVYEIGSLVTALDCSDGKFYYKDGTGTTFSLPDKTAVQNYTFQEYDELVSTDDGEYKLLDGKINYCPKASAQYEEIASDETFSKLKKYDGVAYAVGGDKLYKLLKTELEHVNPSYTDFSKTSQIIIGNTVDKLKGCNLDKPHFVSLKGGAYITSLNLDDLSGEYFRVGKTYKIGASDAPAAGKEALLLCKTGANDEVSIVTLGGVCYMMLTENAPEVEKPEAMVPTDNTTATVSIAESFAYSSPYVCNGTKLFALKSGETVKVLGKVLKTTSSELVRDFYKIEYTDENGETVTGYVPFGYISEFNYSEDEPFKTEDPDYTQSDAVKTVILVLVIVALVLIAVGYLTYVTTSDKTKKRNKGNNKKGE
ncbi:MAG: hypothetical protein HDP34_03660 [Clostridia bacterium]|nr:hypothetical protein [Clostridia bacterium]